MKNVEAVVKPGAKMTITIELEGNVVRHVRLMAASVEEREEGLKKLELALPYLEMLESCLTRGKAVAEGENSNV